MRTAKRIITASLTAIMIFQALAPSTEIFAQELDAAWNGSIAAAHSMNDAVEGAKSAIAQFAENTSGGDDVDNADAPTPGDSSITGDEVVDDAGQEGAESDGAGDGQADGSGEDEMNEDDVAGDSAEQENKEIAPTSVDTPFDFNRLKAVLDSVGGSLVEDDSDPGKASEISVPSSAALVLVSNAQPEVYQNAVITVSGLTGGNADITAEPEIITDDGSKTTYTFQGFGSDSAPFAGSLRASSGGSLSLVSSRTVFNNIQLSDQNSNISVIWKGAGDYRAPVIASVIDGNNQTLVATVTVNDIATNPGESDVAISSALLGTVKGTLSLDATYNFSATRKGVAVTSDGNAGLLANTLEGGAALTVKTVKGLGSIKGDPSITASAAASSAGGLIGYAGQGSTVAFESAVDVSDFSVKATDSAGGIIGKAEGFDLAIPDSVTLSPALTVGDTGTLNAGGAIGSVSFKSDFTVKSTMFNFGETAEGVKLAAGSAMNSPRAGGLFGCLDLKNGNVTVQGGDFKSALVGGVDDSNHRGSYGGIVGIVYDSGTAVNDSLPRLTLEKDNGDKAKSAITRKVDSNNAVPCLHYIGGAVGYIGTTDLRENAAAVIFDGIEIACYGENYANAGANGKFGGAIGVVSGASVADFKDVKVSTDKAIGSNSYSGAGLIGSAWRAVVKFSGTTDLSDAKFNDNNTAQLIYEYWSSLAFATGSGSDSGWTYRRPNDPVAIDDINSYGEVIRLSEHNALSPDLFTLDEGYNLSVKDGALPVTGGAVTIASADDYAKLALALQAYGQFPTLAGIDYDQRNVNSFLGVTVNVNGSIDLTGTGLGGLMKDGEPSGGTGGFVETTMAFSGKLTGSGTINLAIGEPYGMRGATALGEGDSSAGNGEIYRHTRLGLFSQVNGATFENVTVGGIMRFDDKHGSAVDAGALAARKTDGATTVSGVTVKTKLTYDCTGGNPANIGGMFGQIVGGASTTITFKDSSKANAVISSYDSDAKNARVGGVIGFLSGAEGVTVESDGLTIGGEITLKSQAQLAAGGFIGQVDGASTATIAVNGLTVGNKKTDDTDFKATAAGSGARILAGGLIGYIAQGNAKKVVTVTGLNFDSFAMETDLQSAAGGNGKTSGGLLGYSWGNTEFTLGGESNAESDRYAFTTENVSLVATGATGVGGLVYAASGCWTVADKAVDLSGMTIAASSATKLGLLVCRGGANNGDNDYVGIDRLTGLYIKNTAYWGDAYNVNAEPNAISADKVTTFDEWMADACCTGKPVDDCSTNGLVSLHTQSDKLDMSGDVSARSTYENRTALGQSKTGNISTRYYYNLDRAYNKVKGLDRKTNAKAYMSTPEELLLWSAYRYAPSAVRPYVADSGWALITGTGAKFIGQSDGSTKMTIDLGGYSYYPVDYTDGDININNAKIVFHYEDISKEEQADSGKELNKDNAQKTQHANMHVGLFRNFMPLSSQNNSIKVSNVTLAGTIGVDALNGGSGALVCKRTEGNSTGTRIAGVSINGLVIDGLKVANIDVATDGVAPLLVNATKSYTSLEVKHLSVVEDGYKSNDGVYVTAATSLFGVIGGETADMVTVRFSEGIDVPSKIGETIFSHASFLESFSYGDGKTGTATYIFYKKDETAEGYGVTYGKEIDWASSEWHGKQYWYYDAETHGKEEGLVTDGSVKASETDPQFGGYLPYVYTRNGKTNLYHEIKVNHYTANLVVGCGTYGDPFTLSTDAEVYAATDYIRSGQPIDGWKITIAKNQNDSTAICSRRNDGSIDQEITYTYDASKIAWTATSGGTSLTLDNEVMHTYMQSAYYSIEPADTEGSSEVTTLELDGDLFGGFGNESNPFRGVIVGNLKNGVGAACVKITKKNNSIQGLIPYSYGSVVKDLKVTYDGGLNSVQYAGKNDNAVPKAFFGGAIGCIVGGDNIIDTVSVSVADGGAFSVQGIGGTGANAGKGNLVPIGGYVGAIAGGGVIFRGMNKDSVDSSWRSGTATDNKLYDNPYVGRVIDGFAFTEGCLLDNGIENYKINVLNTEDTECVIASGTNMKYEGSGSEGASVEVRDAQGLLVLSAIINSGAAAGAAHTNYGDADGGVGTYRGSLAYQGSSESGYETKQYQFGNEKYGKVRNAAYSNVGQGDPNGTDWKTALIDDRLAPGNQDWKGPLDNNDSDAAAGKINSPYLVKKYANWATGYICANRMVGIVLSFAKDSDGKGKTFDMTSYGSGFLGLSGRYYSNACVANANSLNRNRKFIIPLIACIDGNEASLKIERNVREYANDDYKASAIGGLFDYVAYKQSNMTSSIAANEGYSVRNLTFTNCNISLEYEDVKGNKTLAQSDDNVQVAVGCLAGSTSSVDDQSQYGKYKNVILGNCTVAGTASGGGLLGSAGYCSISTIMDSNSKMLTNGNVSTPVKLIDCQIKKSSVTAESNVGGYVGKLNTFANASIAVDTTRDGFLAIEGLTVSATARRGNEGVTVGGVIGLSGSAVEVGQDEAATVLNRIQIRNLKVTTDTDTGYVMTRGVGGIVGRAENYKTQIAHVDFANGGTDSDYIGSKKGAAQSSGDPRYKSVGGLIGYASTDAKIEDCTIGGVEIAAREASGAIMGETASGSVEVDGVSVDACTIDGAYSGGVLGASKDASTISISNTKVINSTFRKNTIYWSWSGLASKGTYSGGFLGDTKGVVRMVNILTWENTFEEPSYQGQLIGSTNANLKGIYVAGVSVKPKNTDAGIPEMVRFENGDIEKANKKNKIYIAFADYNGTNSDHTDGGPLYNDEGGDAVDVDPHVTTSPVSDVSVSTDGATDRKLFGDGAAISTAKTIKEDMASSAVGKYLYNNIGGTNADGAYQTENAYDPTSSESSFNTNNISREGESGGIQLENDFKVLLIPGNDTTTVANYLNVVTNGGFSDALRFNGNVKSDNSHVTATAQTFIYDPTSKKFVLSPESSLTVVDDGTKSMSFRASSDWDNGKQRFTLLTVTFKEGGQSYKVQVPIIVKRMLEIDFTATFVDGTEFKSSEYSKYGANYHTLSSFGDAMTGYLTWTYNEAKGISTEYGWDTFLESGASMGPLGKRLEFTGQNGTMPAGTQLTLIDAAHDDKAYSYTVGNGGATSVALKDFVAEDGKTHYAEQWLSEIMGVSAKEDSAGAWVTCDSEDASAGAKIGETYYRPYKNGDKGDRFTLKVEKDKNGKEKVQSENFYLIVRVPQGASDRGVNGYTATSFENTNINKNINYTLRTNDRKDVDAHENTASTYNIYSSYRQELDDNADQGIVSVETVRDTGSTNYKLQFDVTDTVTFGTQEYNTNDGLYFKLGASLTNYDNGTIATATGFPSGVSGDIKFYVSIGENYYKWIPAHQDAGKLVTGAWAVSSDEDPVAVPVKSWQSTGDDVSLTLADAAGNPVNLEGIRAEANKAGKTFKIRVTADGGSLTMTEPACQAGIAASTDDDANVKHTKIAYRSTLSPHSEKLDTSSMTQVNNGVRGYYRINDSSAPKISLDAALTSQLGINIDDLKSADGTIALTGKYDFSEAKNGSANLAAATTATYTLTLQRRQEDGIYADVGANMGDYISVVSVDQGLVPTVGASGIVFTDEKGVDGKFATRDGDSLALVLGFRVKVNTSVEAREQFYSNYRLVLTAGLSGGGVKTDETKPKNAQGLYGYDNSDYVTYTLTRVKTTGVDHVN